MNRLTLLVVMALVVVACGAGESSDVTDTTAQSTTSTTVQSLARLFPDAPDVPDGPLTAGTSAVVDAVFDNLAEPLSQSAVEAFAQTDDARLTWLLADLLRFARNQEVIVAATEAASELTGVEFSAPVPWVTITDHLLVWDLAIPPGYEEYKRRLFTTLDARWSIAFTDNNVIDDRLLSWGGVLPDDRPFGDNQPCPLGCIPALDDPATTDAAGGDWYPDDMIVFGIEINGESRAYPRNIMQVHEMVNDTLGGRDFGLPYCTLCGSAQLFFTDDVDGFARPVLRTSGLLSRSNKVMYDLETGSVFDTFTGEALSGPLLDAAVRLNQGTVVVSTWSDWRFAHPDTSIVAQDGGIGRIYDLDPLRGRDDQGPIFPIGDRDLRLAVQEQVVGVITDSGQPVAFPAEAARAAIESGAPVTLEGISLELDGSGFRALSADGELLASHQAFWFAWSQFHADTLVWEG